MCLHIRQLDQSHMSCRTLLHDGCLTAIETSLILVADHGWSQEQHPDIEDLLQRMARCEQLEEVNSLGFGFRSTFIEVWNDDSHF